MPRWPSTRWRSSRTRSPPVRRDVVEWPSQRDMTSNVMAVRSLTRAGGTQASTYSSTMRRRCSSMPIRSLPARAPTRQRLRRQAHNNNNEACMARERETQPESERHNQRAPRDIPGLGYLGLGSTEQQRDERKVGLAFMRGCCCSSLLVLGLVALLCLSTTVDAWGSDGHKIVAQIAQTFLTSAAQAAVQKQLVCRRYRHRRH